jgi:hypothetical protein
MLGAKSQDWLYPNPARIDPLGWSDNLVMRLFKRVKEFGSAMKSSGNTPALASA